MEPLKKIMKEEIRALEKIAESSEMVDLLKGCQIIACRSIYINKHRVDGLMEMYEYQDTYALPWPLERGYAYGCST